MDVRVAPKIAHSAEIVLVGNADVIWNRGEKDHLDRVLEAVEILGYTHLAVNLSSLGFYSECYCEVVCMEACFNNSLSGLCKIDIRKPFGGGE